MTCEQAFFLKVLSDHIAKKKTEPIANIDWGVLVQWARIHQVDGILYYQCREYMPSNILNMLELRFNGAFYVYKNRENILQTIDKAFKMHNIPYLTIKGIEVANCYPLPFLRTMGDSDIIVDKEDKEKAGAVLEELGFSIKEKNPDYDWLFVKMGMMFELHHNLLYKEVMTIDKQAKFFNEYWNYEYNGKLDWSFHYLYLIEHLRKHIMYSGAGFRMFMDLAVVADRISTLDWEWIENKLSELGMLKFAQVCFALIEQWFGIRIPLKYSQVDPLFVENATEKVFLNGVFGFNNEENTNNGAINQLTKDGTVSLCSRLNMLIRMMFPSYNNMANSPYYHFVRGKVWLLPVAWLVRIFRLIRGNTLSIGEIMKNVTLPEEIIDKRAIELKEWGLWD